jgi:hypothetical protein
MCQTLEKLLSNFSAGSAPDYLTLRKQLTIAKSIFFALPQIWERAELRQMS